MPFLCIPSLLINKDPAIHRLVRVTWSSLMVMALMVVVLMLVPAVDANAQVYSGNTQNYYAQKYGVQQYNGQLNPYRQPARGEYTGQVIQSVPPSMAHNTQYASPTNQPMMYQPINQPFNPTMMGNVRQHQVGAQQWHEPESILIILDASGSMIDGLPNQNGGKKKSSVSKMAAAKQAILSVLKHVPPHVNVGLRVYGSKQAKQFFACRATKLLVPIGPHQQHQIASQLVGIRPNGPTPISYTLLQAINKDFAYVRGKKSILLVSDGMETCGDDPCRVAVDMQKNHIDVKINIIGFGLEDLGAQRQLKCISMSTFGQYHTANTSAELVDELSRGLYAQTEVQGKIILPPRNTQPALPQQPKPTPVIEKEYTGR